MRSLLALAFALSLFALACAGQPSEVREKAETPLAVAQRFLSLWQEGDYDQMYDLLSAEAGAAISRDKLVGRYQAIAEEATITGIDFQIAVGVAEEATEVPYTVTIHTAFFGDIVQENVIALVPETAAEEEGPGRWRVQWSPSLIFKELDDRTLVHFFPVIPRRGTIFDRQGRALAVDTQVPVVGVVPDLIRDEERVIAALAEALKLAPEVVRAKVTEDVPSYYFIPIATLPYATPPETLQTFYAMADLGVVVREETRRIYPFGDSADHVLGYLAEVTPEQLEKLAR